MTEGFLNEFMLPRHSAEQSPAYKPTPQGPSALNSPRAYHRRLAATSAPGSHLPAQVRAPSSRCCHGPASRPALPRTACQTSILGDTMTEVYGMFF